MLNSCENSSTFKNEMPAAVNGLAFLTTTEQAVMTGNIILPPNSKAIPLTKGKFAIVDEADYEWLMEWKWYLLTSRYVGRSIYLGCFNGKPKTTALYMHRAIMNTPDGMSTDHINGDGLDNRKCNLRICTRSENMRNQKKRKGSSQYKGVSWVKRHEQWEGRWEAHIRVSGLNKYIGQFKKEEEAALAYNAAALKYFGEFAKLNEVMS